MEEKQTKVSSFLTSILPTVKVEPVYDQTKVIETGAIVFIVTVAIIFSYFSLKKYFK